jgi:AraC-like DNA-binding protein
MRTESAYRSMGRARESLIGVGFQMKPGRTVDVQDAKSAHYSAVWCLRGRGVYRDEAGATWPLRPGSLFHRFTDRRHSTTLDPASNWGECWIALNAPLALALQQMGALDHRRAVQQPGVDLALVEDLSRLIGILREAEEAELPRLAAQLVTILAELTTRDGAREAADPYRALVDRSCRRLADDQRLPLAAVAAEQRMSYERFRKVFRERMGVSPGEYRIRRRIDRARALLQARDLPIKAIAEVLGYANPYAFSAQFKQLVGESPEAFRRRH